MAAENMVRIFHDAAFQAHVAQDAIGSFDSQLDGKIVARQEYLVQVMEKLWPIILGKPCHEVLTEQVGALSAKHGGSGLVDFQRTPICIQGKATDRHQIVKNGMVLPHVSRLLLGFPKFVLAPCQFGLVERRFMRQALGIVLIAWGRFTRQIFTVAEQANPCE